MSEAKIQSLEKITENVESDTDNEKDLKGKNNKKKKYDEDDIPKDLKGNAIVFNQSNQNFAKFSLMAKNNNQSSFSDQSISKFDNSYDNENSDLYSNYGDMKKSKNPSITNKQKHKQKKTETLNSDLNKDLNNRYDYETDSNLKENEETMNVNNNENRNFNILEREREMMKLNFYDIDQFLDLDIDREYKYLLNIMKKFKVDNSILSLDTKMKAFIPNFIPTIGEVDAFIKINRPDNELEEIGLDIVDEPIINGIDPNIFSLELSYKMKTKIPDNLIIKSIENADKNPKQISTWIENLDHLHRGTSNNFVTYSKKMPEIEELMQVRKRFD